jgi:hypothetical protein
MNSAHVARKLESRQQVLKDSHLIVRTAQGLSDGQSDLTYV